ncbi:uncharacterized protein SCHCODRAFT_02607644 [Schizophyllum commune H4-8]|uniref:uncharacterized protein n=1 Tax=Schizophyllum commune (strain H4-8 / FGSC 9210) TaxID=578458 RepID=UPI00215FBC20|nr:uncharacterized protein SCHCODRAFT_02607644 [Schizophyllum commune H4-8]KAI5900330.1 hypothetical protein SCHCODRAFT_02607644 [Schizophyllum commune H4-8]
MVRIKNRWLLVEFLPVDDGALVLSEKTIWAAVKQSVVHNFGDAGWGGIGVSLSVKYYSPTTHMCILKVGREYHNTAWGAVTLLTAIDGRRIVPHVVHVSGTIKHAQMAAVTHNRAVVARLRARANRSASYRDSYDDYLENSERDINALKDY